MREVGLYLSDIISACERIERFKEGITKETFAVDIKTQDAIIRNIEIIGEAMNKIPIEIRVKDNSIPWRNIVSMRNFLAHGYFEVDLDLIWEVASTEIPILKQKIVQMNIGN